ncbi:MAG: D-erythronate dehydrogenase, partial [Pseudomonadota bacterium]
MRVLIIGGGGFLGQKLAEALASRGHLCGRELSSIVLADLLRPDPPKGQIPVETIELDITDPVSLRTAISAGFDVIYHLAAIVSGQAESEFDLGMQVNLTGSINVFEAVRALGTCPVVVFTSSIAVYGGDIPDPIPDWAMLNPQTSYGAQKAAAELLLTDYSRKGFLDGRGLRLPTISVRPGKANKAASSFMSSIFREPLQGQEAVCPVPPDYAHWFLSPHACIKNLLHAAEVEAGAWGSNRCLALPGRTHTIGEMVEAMRRVAGDAAPARIRWEPDPAIQAIVNGWKARFDPARAIAMGFQADE